MDQHRLLERTFKREENMKMTIKKIWRPVILYLVALSLMLGVTLVALAQSLTSIDFSGATITRPFGINLRGDIVGMYVIVGVIYGFLLSDGQFITFDVPGATATNPIAINPRGDIVGWYVSAGVTHG